MNYRRWPRALAGVAFGTATLLCLAAFTGRAATHSPGAANVQRVSYQLHMVFFSHEAGLSTVIDPQMFVSSPGAPAGVGPQGIYHVANIAPAPMTAPPATPLLDANGAGLGVSLGQWEAARGRATLVCRGQTQLVESRFRDLLPRGVYSLFVVHFAVQGAGRFTPLGTADGSDDSFIADPAGHGQKAVATSPCLTSSEGVVLAWHSDGQTHGSSIGMPGYTSHNQLIFPVP